MKHELSVFSEEMTADEVVSVNIREYGHHTLLTKIVDMTDGLKPVHRYILWTILKNEKPIKVLSYAGSIMDKYWPVGDAAICEAIIKLTQPFSNLIPLILSDSNVGAYGGGEAAKPRYLPISSHPFTRDVYFTGIDTGTFNYIISETGEGVVPEYFIPKIPMALFTGFFGIAIGFRSKPARINLGALCSMVQTYSELHKQYGGLVPKAILRDSLAGYLVPDFPTEALIRNRQELVSKYLKGDYDARVVLDGVMHITPTMITIHSLPPDVSPTDVYELLGRLRANKDPFVDGNFQEILDASSGRTTASIECTLKRGVNPFVILDQFKKLIGFTKSWTPCTFMVSKDRISKQTTPIEVLEEWFIERSRSIMAELKLAQGRHIEKIRQLKAQLIIVDHVDEVVELFKQSPNRDATIKPLCERFDLTQYQAKFISKLTLGHLTNMGMTELQDQLKEAEDKIKAIQKKFLSVNQTIHDDAEELHKKYADQAGRKCNEPIFMGAVKIFGNGYIQYKDLKEMISIVGRFGEDNVELMIYPAGPKNKLVIAGGIVETEDELAHPKEFKADRFEVSRFKPKTSVGLRNDTIYRVKGLHSRSDGDLVFSYVGDQFTSVNKTGNVSVSQTSELKARQTVIAQGVLTDIIHVSPVISEEVIVVHCNSHKSEINTVRIQRIKADGSKLDKLPMGKLHIIGVYRPDEVIQFSVPTQYLNRCRIQHFHLDGKELTGSIRLELSRKVVSDNRKIARLQKGAKVYTIQ